MTHFSLSDSKRTYIYRQTKMYIQATRLNYQ